MRCCNGIRCYNRCCNSLHNINGRIGHNIESNIVSHLIFIILLAPFRFLITPSGIEGFTLFLEGICTLGLNVPEAFTLTALKSFAFLLGFKQVCNSFTVLEIVGFAEILLSVLLLQNLVEIFGQGGKCLNQIFVINIISSMEF